MPVISRTDKKSAAGRFTIALMYAFLLLGSVAMVYPFLLMLAGSTKSAFDATENRIIPAYLVNDLALYRKFIESHYNEAFDFYRFANGGSARSFAQVDIPKPVDPAILDLWEEFESKTPLPSHFYAIGMMSAGQSRGVIPANARLFIEYLQTTYGRSEAAVNSALGTSILSWSAFDFRPQNFYIRGQLPRRDGLARAYRDWQVLQPPGSRIYFNVTGQYRSFLRNQFGSDIAAFNAAAGTTYSSYDEVPLPRSSQQTGTLSPKERELRLVFLREVVNPLWLRVSPEATQQWRAYLAARHGSIDVLNRLAGTSYSTFEEIPLNEFLPDRGQLLVDWTFFIRGWTDPSTGQNLQFPDEYLSFWDVQFAFREFLEEKAKTAALPAVEPASVPMIDAPFSASDYATFESQKSGIRWEFTVRNYQSVWGFLAVNGRGIVNTIIFCALAVGAALIFNPMAAYALSRFRPPLTYKLLLFLMLTMAFPPMVTQIPVFLMLRQFDLLNTFAALILPGLANGYSIFLLKGFFDSLPRELYESSELDGASEWVIFWQITMSLSKPILAVIALGAFTGAYSAFMFALLLCQDQSMWTIMVWLYQLQQRSGEGIVFASLLIAAVPTLIVFLFAQKIIMRGIAVPVEK